MNAIVFLTPEDIVARGIIDFILIDPLQKGQTFKENHRADTGNQIKNIIQH